jgi:catechol 2,3-dioxygenase-like lactoylglutathione lyase family enzyme
VGRACRGPSLRERSRPGLLDIESHIQRPSANRTAVPARPDPRGAARSASRHSASRTNRHCRRRRRGGDRVLRSPSYEGDAGPPPANAPGIRHILFVVDDVEALLAGLRAHGGKLVNYENSYWLCYVRGPAGIIIELAEKIG